MSNNDHADGADAGRSPKDAPVPVGGANPGVDKDRMCKFCFGEEEGTTTEQWSAPCHCSGSIKWVHKDCLHKWISSAPAAQQSHCNTCKFSYRRCWTLKPVRKWAAPDVSLSYFDALEIIIDMSATWRLFQNGWSALQGRVSIFSNMFYFLCWRSFVFTSRRAEYYKSLSRKILSSIFEVSIQDAGN